MTETPSVLFFWLNSLYAELGTTVSSSNCKIMESSSNDQFWKQSLILFIKLNHTPSHFKTTLELLIFEDF